MNKTLKFLSTLILLFIAKTLSFAQTNAIEVGDTAPYFKGYDQHDSLLSSSRVLAKSDNIVVVFYRGSWCGYCKKHLASFSDSIQLILDKNTSLIVVTPETPISREAMVSKTGSKFSIISDTSYSILKAFGVDYQISEITVPRYNGRVTELTKKSNGNDSGILPIPATYIIGNDGVVKWSHVDMDYSKRSTVKEILSQL